MSPYDNWQFNYSLKLNQSVKRLPPCRAIKLFGNGSKNDMCLADLIKWVKANPKEAVKKDFNNYQRFLKK
jgi:hypothetical protein